jgi:uncharacterized membrane protein
VWAPWADPGFNLRAPGDAVNHLLRIYVFEWMLQQGVWLPRWVPDLAYGYGYPLFNYCAPGLYYLAVAVRQFGLDV